MFSVIFLVAFLVLNASNLVQSEKGDCSKLGFPMKKMCQMCLCLKELSANEKTKELGQCIEPISKEICEKFGPKSDVSTRGFSPGDDLSQMFEIMKCIQSAFGKDLAAGMEMMQTFHKCMSESD